MAFEKFWNAFKRALLAHDIFAIRWVLREFNPADFDFLPDHAARKLTRQVDEFTKAVVDLRPWRSYPAEAVSLAKPPLRGIIKMLGYDDFYDAATFRLARPADVDIDCELDNYEWAERWFLEELRYTAGFCYGGPHLWIMVIVDPAFISRAWDAERLGIKLRRIYDEIGVAYTFEWRTVAEQAARDKIGHRYPGRLPAGHERGLPLLVGG